MRGDMMEARRHIEALFRVIGGVHGAFGAASCEYCASVSAAQAFLTRLDGEGQRVEGGDEDERKWLVWYHDPDMPSELIVRGGNAEECARKRHADQLSAWSCHLFREVFPGEQVVSGAELTRLKAEQSDIRSDAVTTLTAQLAERDALNDELTSRHAELVLSDHQATARITELEARVREGATHVRDLIKDNRKSFTADAAAWANTVSQEGE